MSVKDIDLPALRVFYKENLKRPWLVQFINRKNKWITIFQYKNEESATTKMKSMLEREALRKSSI